MVLLGIDVSVLATHAELLSEPGGLDLVLRSSNNRSAIELRSYNPIPMLSQESDFKISDFGGS